MRETTKNLENITQQKKRKHDRGRISPLPLSENIRIQGYSKGRNVGKKARRMNNR